MEKDHSKQPPASFHHSSDGGKTCGRWTSEEHKKFVEALKKFGKQWKKVEEYIQTRSGAQIRSHAQKYFLKIQKEYPDQDPYEIFKNNSPEFLEDAIYMKNRGESEERESSSSHLIKHSANHHSSTGKDEKSEKEVQEEKEEEDNSFANSIKNMLAKKGIYKFKVLCLYLFSLSFLF